MTTGGNNLRGALTALAAFGIFATHDVAVKVLGAQYSAFQVVFFSVLLGFPIVTVMLMRDRTEVTDCVVRQMYRYANARVEKNGEDSAIDVLNEKFAASGYRLTALMTEIATSDGFRFAGLPLDDVPGATP